MMNKLFTILIILMLFSCNKEVSIKVNIKDKVSVEDSVQNKNFDLKKDSTISSEKSEVMELKEDLTISVPNYIGLDLKEVQKRVKKDKLVLKSENILPVFHNEVPEGKVSFQIPKAGNKVLNGESLIIYVSKGPPKSVFVIPDIIGRNVEKAISKLRDQQFSIGKIDTVFYEELLPGTVWEIYYSDEDDEKIETFEGDIFTVPIPVNLVITSDDEKLSIEYRLSGLSLEEQLLSEAFEELVKRGESNRSKNITPHRGVQDYYGSDLVKKIQLIVEDPNWTYQESGQTPDGEWGDITKFDWRQWKKARK